MEREKGESRGLTRRSAVVAAPENSEVEVAQKAVEVVRVLPPHRGMQKCPKGEEVSCCQRVSACGDGVWAGGFGRC